MCPGTLALLGAASAAGGALAGGVSSGNAAAYQAQVARQNATTEQQNAERAASATSAQVNEAGLKARAQDAGVKAAAAANGVDVNTGSAADVSESQRRLGAIDVANVGERGAETTYGYETSAVGDRAQAQLDQSQVGADYLGGALKAGGSLLSAAPDMPSPFGWMGKNIDISGLSSMNQPGINGSLTGSDVHILDG